MAYYYNIVISILELPLIVFPPSEVEEGAALQCNIFFITCRFFALESMLGAYMKEEKPDKASVMVIYLIILPKVYIRESGCMCRWSLGVHVVHS
jgi:hypothetical protein